jgi:hypothetical protein
MSKTPSVTVSSALTQRVTTATTNAFNALQDQLRRVFQQEALQLKQSGGTATLRMVDSDVDKVKRWAQESSAGATLDAGIAKFFKLPADMKQQALLPVTSNDARNQVFADVSRRGADTGLKARVAAVLTGTAAALASWWGSGARPEMSPIPQYDKNIQPRAPQSVVFGPKTARATGFMGAYPVPKSQAPRGTNDLFQPTQYGFVLQDSYDRARDLNQPTQHGFVLKDYQAPTGPSRFLPDEYQPTPAELPKGYIPPKSPDTSEPSISAPEPSIWSRLTGSVSEWWNSITVGNLTGDQATTSLLPVVLLSLTAVAAGGYALWKWKTSGTQTVTVDQFVQMKLTERESQEGLQSLGIRYDQGSDEFRPLSNDPMHVGRAKLFTLLKGNGSITVNTATVKVQ